MVIATARYRVMVDATVLVAGSSWPRWPHEVLLAGLRGDIQIVLCPYVTEQATHALRRRFPQHLARFSVLMAQLVFEFVPDPTAEQVEQNQSLVRDVTDVPVALAAINARVDYLVSEDKDLTAQDETTAVLRQKLAVRLSGTFLREVMGWTGAALESIRHRTWLDYWPTDIPMS